MHLRGLLPVPEALPFGERARQWAFFKSWRLREGLVRLIVPRRTVDSRGLRFTLPADNWITYYRWKTYNEKEPETLDWVDGLRADDVLFDIGANIGLYSLYAAKRHPGIRIAAFEPEYSNLHLLRDNVAENGLGGQMTIYAVALGDSNGLSYLHVQDLHPGAALHTVSADPIAATRTDRPVLGREGIVQMTIDAFVEQSGLQPTCMKIDVDGNEREVLSGGRRTLAHPSFRTMLIELPQRPEERTPCAELLAAAGLQQTWHDAAGASQNEVWTRR
jgi:FkbM family methyltransferase